MHRFVSTFLLSVLIGACSGAPTTTRTSTDPVDAKPVEPTSEVAAPRGTADGAPRPEVKQDPTLSVEQRQSYLAALREGRAHHKAKDYAAAIAAFQRALALYPDDPRALSELGWAAFFAKDLELAEKATREAIQRTSDANIKGASLYNLGRIQEEQGHPEEAIVSYGMSLRVRPNDIVLERLGRLDAEAAQRFAVFQPRLLSGPHASLDAVCAALVEANAYLDKPWCTAVETELGEVSGPTRLDLAAPPFDEARFVLLGADTFDTSYPTEANYALAVRQGASWFVSPPVAYVYNPGAFGIFESLTVVSMTLQDIVPGEAPALVVRFDHDRSDSDMGINEAESEHSEFLLLCGVGKQASPSCIGPITVAASYERGLMWEDDAEAGLSEPIEHNLGKSEWRTNYRLLESGELEITPGGGDPGVATLGRHVIAF